MTNYCKFSEFVMYLFVCVCTHRRSQRTWVTAPTLPSFLWRMPHQSQKLKVTAPPPTTSLSTTLRCPGKHHLTLSLLLSLLLWPLSLPVSLPIFLLLPFLHLTKFCYFLSSMYTIYLPPELSTTAAIYCFMLACHTFYFTTTLALLLSSLSSCHHLPCTPCLFLCLCSLLWYPTRSPVYERTVNFSSQFWTFKTF